MRRRSCLRVCYVLLSLSLLCHTEAHAPVLQHYAATPYDTVAELRDFIASIGMTVEAFKQLPVYVWNVDKPELAWLKDL